MQRAKAFFYVSLSILALAVAFHLGATTAKGQAGVPVTNFTTSGGQVLVMTPEGDLYSRGYDWWFGFGAEPARPLGNFWSGNPVQTQGTTWGRIKAERR